MAKKCKHEFYPVAFFRSSHEGLADYLICACAYCDAHVAESGEQKLDDEDDE